MYWLTKTQKAITFVCAAIGILNASSMASQSPPTWKLEYDGMTLEMVLPGKGEASIEKILEACEQFLATVGLPRPKDIVPGVGRGNTGGKRDTYLSVRYDQFYWFTVTATNGRLTSFKNYLRESEYSGGRAQKTPFVLTDPINARGFVTKIAKKLGLDDRYQIVDFKWLIEEGRNSGSPQKAKLVFAKIEAFEHGYPLATFDHAGFLIDPADGVLLSFSVSNIWKWTIESHEAKLTFNQAKAIAEPYVKKYRLGEDRTGIRKRPLSNTGSNFPTRLEYVLPNGIYDGVKYDCFESPMRLRLAWVIWYPGLDCIYIDAADGRILGGVY